MKDTSKKDKLIEAKNLLKSPLHALMIRAKEYENSYHLEFMKKGKLKERI